MSASSQEPGGKRCFFGGALAQANWLNARRVRDYPRIFLVIYIIVAVMYLSVTHNGIDPLSRPLGTDFMDVWAAGKLADKGRPADAYDYKKHYAEQVKALPWQKGAAVPFYGWHYPPVFLLLAAPLAFMPYLWALFVWMAATLPLYLAAIRSIIPGRVAMTAALAFPGVFMTLGHGQNSFLTTALLGGGLLALHKRPWFAGFCFGLLCYKPQFGLIIPVALLAGGYWRAIFAAGATVISLCILSWFVFGMEAWLAFFNSLPLTEHYVLEQGATGWEKFQSIFAAVRMLGGSIKLAYAFQLFQTLFCALWLVRVWRSKLVDPALKYALLVTAAMMSTPYVMDYDLTAMALPIAWITVIGLRDGFLPWEKSALVMMFTLPLLSRLLGGLTGVPVGPVMMAFFLLALLNRVTFQEEKGTKVA